MKKIVKAGMLLSLLATLGLTSCGGTSSTPTDPSGSTPITNPSNSGTVKVNGVSLNKKVLSKDAGYSEKLTATVLPENATNKKVTWSTSDPSVAIVSETGEVTAVNQGTAKITVKTEDGSFAASCDVTVSGLHLSKKVFENFGKLDLNSYNVDEEGKEQFGVDVSNEDYLTVKFKRSTTKAWASLQTWFDSSIAASKFDFEVELVKGDLPAMLVEFAGENKFKFYEEIKLEKGVKKSLSLNLTDINIKGGEEGAGSWGFVYIEPNNPLHDDDPAKTSTEEVELRIHKMKLIAGEKAAPEKIKNVEFNSEAKKLQFDKNYASKTYDLEVYKIDGDSETKLTLDTVPTRFQAFEHLPNMKYSFLPKKGENFAEQVGSYKARVRGVNSVGAGEWSDFAAFEIKEAPAATSYETEGFADEGKISVNGYNGNKTFVSELTAAGYKVTFLSENAEPAWDSVTLGFDNTIAWKHVRVELEVIKGNIATIGCEFSGPDAASKQQYEHTVVAGKNIIEFDITADLSKGWSVFALQLDKTVQTGDAEVLISVAKLTK